MTSKKGIVLFVIRNSWMELIMLKLEKGASNPDRVQ